MLLSEWTNFKYKVINMYTFGDNIFTTHSIIRVMLMKHEYVTLPQMSSRKYEKSEHSFYALNFSD